MTKTFVMTDIHGMYDKFEIALDQIKRDFPEKDERNLILLGDYIDRGPKSRQVVSRILEERQANEWNKMVIILGNHEDMAFHDYARLMKGEDLNPTNSVWLQHGGYDTIESYEDYFEKITFDKLGYDLADLSKVGVDYYEDEHRVYVHACVSRGGKSLAAEHGATLKWTSFNKDDDYTYNGKHIVHGHTPCGNGKAMLKTNRTNLDVGSFFTRKLAIGMFDDDIPGGPMEVYYV